MRTQFIPNEPNSQYDNFANNIDQAYALMPWAVLVVEVEGGYKGFECINDYELWLNQE